MYKFIYTLTVAGAALELTIYAYGLHRFTRLPVYPDPVDIGVSTSGTYSRAAIVVSAPARVKGSLSGVTKESNINGHKKAGITPA